MEILINRIEALFNREALPAVLSLATEREEYLVALDRTYAVGRFRAKREVRVTMYGKSGVGLTATLADSQCFAAHLLSRIADLCPRELVVAGMRGDDAMIVTPQTTGVSAAQTAGNLAEALCNAFNAAHPEGLLKLSPEWVRADAITHPDYQSRIDATLKMWSE